MNARILLILDCVQGGRLGGWWLECVAKDGWCSVGPGGAQSASEPGRLGQGGGFR